MTATRPIASPTMTTKLGPPSLSRCSRETNSRMNHVIIIISRETHFTCITLRICIQNL